MSDIRSYRQAKTRLEYKHVDGRMKQLTDRCLIFPDPDNKGWYLAVSQETSLAGMGKTREAAYSTLTASMTRLMGFAFKKNQADHLGTKSTHPNFKTSVRRNIQKISQREQDAWLGRILKSLKDSGEFREIGDTKVDAKSQDTHNGLPAIRASVRDAA